MASICAIANSPTSQGGALIEICGNPPVLEHSLTFYFIFIRARPCGLLCVCFGMHAASTAAQPRFAFV